MHPRQADSLARHKTQASRHNNNLSSNTASTTTDQWKRDCHEGHTPITRMTCLDIAHTLHELANEGKLIIGHALDIMQGTNWDYYAQKNESR